MLASTDFHNETDSPKGEGSEVGNLLDVGESPEKPQDHASSGVSAPAVPNEYVQLQQRIFLVTLIVTAFALAVSVVFFELKTSISLLLGAASGALYLRLLARSVGQLGKGSKSLSKIQLLVPVLLVLSVTRLPQLELIPALLGFLLYKPSLIIQVLMES